MIGKLRVVIESPLGAPDAEGVELNRMYAKRCVMDSLARGEAPYASHLFYAQPGLLDDFSPNDRNLGIESGIAWGECANMVAVYADHGVSSGMEVGINHYRHRGIPVIFRYIDRDIEG